MGADISAEKEISMEAGLKPSFFAAHFETGGKHFFDTFFKLVDKADTWHLGVYFDEERLSMVSNLSNCSSWI